MTARRLLIPSFSDLFFFSLIFWLFLAVESGWQRLLMDGDTGLHLRTGDYILDHGEVPHVDIFSFSKPGQPWFAFEWLTGVLYSFLNRHFGLRGLVVISGAVIALFTTILLRDMLRRGGNCLLAVGLTLVASNATSIHYHARPHLFTLLFFAVLVWLVECDRRSPSAAIWLLVPLTVVWTNMHGGFVAMLAYLGLLVVGLLAEGRVAGARRYALVAAASGLASLINPYGIGLHLHIASVLESSWIQQFVSEFQSPTFRSEAMLCYLLILFLALAISGLLLARRAFVEPLWIGFFAFMSLRSARHVTLFVLAAAPIVVAELTRYWNVWLEGKPKQSVARILQDMAVQAAPRFAYTSAWGPLFVAALLFLNLPIAWPADFDKELFPTAMVTRHADLLRTGRVFTSDQWADYLVYRFYPRQRVFFDGRHNYYGEQIGEDYLALGRGNYNWQRLLAKYGFDVILTGIDSPLATLVKMDPAWRLVEDDGKSILFTHRR